MAMIRNAAPGIAVANEASTLDAQTIKWNLQTLVRQAAAILLLLVARSTVSEWYLNQQNFRLIIFLFELAAAILIAAFPQIKQGWKFLPRFRICIIGVILFLAIPWGEMLRLNFANTREGWAMQLWNQTVFIYALLLVFNIFPKAPDFLHRHTVKILDRLAAKTFVLYLPAILLFLLSSGICLFIYNLAPVVNDSASYLFQAKIFRAGRLFAPIPPLSDFFSYDIDMLVMKDGQWFSMYPPGFPLLLAIAMLFKAEWFLPPLLGAATLAIWIAYAKRWHGPRVALLLGVLCLLSPFIFQMSSTVLIHVPELFIASAVLYLCRKQIEETSLARNGFLVFLLAFGILTRAYSLMIFLAPVLAYTIWKTGRRRILSVGAAILCGILLGSVCLAFYQSKTTGNPWSSAYALEYKNLKYGFGSNYGAQIHTPLRGLELTSNYILGLNHWLTGWYSGSLFFLCAFFLIPDRLQTWDRIFLCSIAAILLFYFAYFFQDLIFGPRFYYILAPILLLWIARSTGINSANPPSKTLTALLMISALSFLPVRFPEFLRIYNPSNDPPEYFTKKVKQLAASKVLVFLEPQVSQDYVNWNDPFLQSNLIFMRDLGDRNTQAIAAFPDYRPFYFRFTNLAFHSGSEENYGFFQTRDSTNPSEISFFALALTLQAGNEFPEKDIFDLTYPQLLSLPGAQAKMRFTNNELIAVEKEPDGYKKDFRKGIMHCAKLMLLPKIAFETDPAGWKKHFNAEEFRDELTVSSKFFISAGETGRPLLAQTKKVQKRIDQNNDSNLSNDEIFRYAGEKILHLVKF